MSVVALKIYKINEKEITAYDIKKIVKKGYDSTIFNLIDAINLKNKDKILKIYNELLEENETEEKILYTIANHYRLLLQIKIQSKDKSDSEIISELVKFFSWIIFHSIITNVLYQTK